jgi:hypothetical protein
VGSYGIKLRDCAGITAFARCVHPEAQQERSPLRNRSVLAPVTATIAALQVADALKILARGADAVIAGSPPSTSGAADPQLAPLRGMLNAPAACAAIDLPGWVQAR